VCVEPPAALAVRHLVLLPLRIAIQRAWRLSPSWVRRHTPAVRATRLAQPPPAEARLEPDARRFFRLPSTPAASGQLGLQLLDEELEPLLPKGARCCRPRGASLPALQHASHRPTTTQTLPALQGVRVTTRS
jgi:hypothetical protein